ncbi:MAG: GGDEF domain-containing protein, partial [Gammaproteobacteria bacterium]|nr:GGDEF domain-containing protein [Gammaproteobacteria bacterium]
RQAWRTLFTGILLSLLLFALLWSMSRTRNRAVMIANELTRNIQQRETALREAHTKAEQFRVALDYVNSFIYIKDKNRRYQYANKSTLALFGCTAEELIGASDEQFFPAETCAQLKEIDTDVLAGHKSRSEIIVRHNDGSRTVYLELKTPVYDDTESGTVTGVLGISTDITSIKDHEEQMERIAHYDALTSLPNRLLLGDRLRQGIAHVNRHGGKLAVVYLDLDGFKTVNDTHGHDVGDELLRMVAFRLKDALRDGDTVARIGGDEFVAVLLDLENDTQINPILHRMMHAAADPVYVRGLSLKVSASMGVSLYPQTLMDDPEGQPGEDKLLRQADQAMYQAKTAGKHRAHLFTGSGEQVVLVTDESQ